MGKKTISYRGSLKSCNYRCSYCPFSRRKALGFELEKDRQQFRRFCDSMEKRAEEFRIGAVFVVPYGEASIHKWYWEGLGRLAGISGIDRVGIQTNLSFPVEECLKVFDLQNGEVWEEGIEKGAGGKQEEGKKKSSGQTERGQEVQGQESSRSRAGEQKNRNRQKLCIWATFHPEMTDVDVFVDQCHKLTACGVNLCAGAVGVPRNIPLIVKLREKLSPDIYLWINKMDGLGRNYTEEEKRAFSETDPFFGQELNNPAADAAMCRERCFVEADGTIHACNISKAKTVNWYEGSEEEIFQSLCGKKRCSCYLAYGGRTDFAGRQFFGEYPIFRIPAEWERDVSDGMFQL